MKLMKRYTSGTYSLARQQQVPVTGPILQEEALKIAEAQAMKCLRLPMDDWSGLSGRHKLKQFVISGEAASVSNTTVAGWLE